MSWSFGGSKSKAFFEQGCNSSKCHCPNCVVAAAPGALITFTVGAVGGGGGSGGGSGGGNAGQSRPHTANRLSYLTGKLRTTRTLTQAEYLERLRLLRSRPVFRMEADDWREYLADMIDFMELGGKHSTFAEWKREQEVKYQRICAERREQAEARRRMTNERAFRDFQKCHIARIAEAFTLPYDTLTGQLVAADYASIEKRIMDDLGLPPAPPNRSCKVVTWQTNIRRDAEPTMRVDLVSVPVKTRTDPRQETFNEEAWTSLPFIYPFKAPMRNRQLDVYALAATVNPSIKVPLVYVDVTPEAMQAFHNYNKKDVEMTMSKDRIEFELFSNANENDCAATLRAASRAFGMTQAEARRIMNTGQRLRCRPSQFGRFIVFRVEEGVTTNQIKNLNVKIVPEVIEALDVSKRAFD